VHDRERARISARPAGIRLARASERAKMTAASRLDYTPARAVGMRTRRPTLEHALGITPEAIHGMSGMNGMNRMNRMNGWLRFVPLPLAIAIAFAITGGASIALASDAPQPEGGVAWRPILAGCLGVFFGAAVAVWQIRGRKKE
jgi:hypothetical protein